jgi:hypothetical protein
MSAFARLYYANRGPGGHGIGSQFDLPNDEYDDPREPLPFFDDPYRMAGHYVEGRTAGPDIRPQADLRQPHDANRARVPI